MEYRGRHLLALFSSNLVFTCHIANMEDIRLTAGTHFSDVQSTQAVAGSDAGDIDARISEVDVSQADIDVAKDFIPAGTAMKRAKTGCNPTDKIDREVMGSNNVEFPFEAVTHRGYALIPTDGGLKHIMVVNALHTMSWESPRTLLELNCTVYIALGIGT